MKMREILFRGKRIDNGEWVDGCLAAYDLICPNYPEDTSNAMGDYYGQTPYVGFVEVDPETVCQFTGLTDKNGKRIFEGDILTLRTGIPHVARFEDGAFFFENTGIPIRFANKFTVIGNIHDNPDLLEDSNA